LWRVLRRVRFPQDSQPVDLWRAWRQGRADPAACHPGPLKSPTTRRPLHLLPPSATRPRPVCTAAERAVCARGLWLRAAGRGHGATLPRLSRHARPRECPAPDAWRQHLHRFGRLRSPTPPQRLWWCTSLCRRARRRRHQPAAHAAVTPPSWAQHVRVWSRGMLAASETDDELESLTGSDETDYDDDE
jgi:hypothetical protein